ncbi:MAG: stalk domain-containing protein [Bacillota bacterium]|nr:stalk domain-containing protein [Bacillota bacterium]
MKRSLSRLLGGMLLLALALGISPTAQAHPEVRVNVNGAPVTMDVPPIIENGRTLVPVRAVSESMGAAVDWDSAQRMVTVQRGGDTILLYIDSANTYVNGQLVPIDVPARIVNSRTLIPLRFIMENMGAEVSWDGVNYIVDITISDTAASSDFSQMERQLLELLNQRRQAAGLSDLQALTQLNELAAAHRQDMAANSFFSSVSPTHGGLKARAAAAQLGSVQEYLAYGLPYADRILAAWLDEPSFSELALSADCAYIGLSLGAGTAAGSATLGDVYAVAELAVGRGVIIGARERFSDADSIQISGYVADSDTPLILYYLRGNDQSAYDSREVIYPQRSSSGYFSCAVPLPQAGTYLLWLDQDSILITRN